MVTMIPRVMMCVCTQRNPGCPQYTCSLVSKETLSPTLSERHMVEFTLISSNRRCWVGGVQALGIQVLYVHVG